MSGQFISLKNAFKEMRAGNPFSLEYISADKKRDTGGKWIEVESAIMMASMGKSDRKKQKAQAATKNPNQSENDTVNIMLTANRFPVCIHARLIKVFNGKTILW